MAAMKHSLKGAFKLGFGKAAKLKHEDVNTICGNMFDFFQSSGHFETWNKITATRLHEDDEHLRNFVIGKVDKHRQGGFIA